MIEHAAQFAAANIPFMFDPGQGMPMFGGEELKTFIAQARWVAVNDYEWGLLQQKTGLTVSDVTAQVEALVVTRGAEGSVIYTKGRTLQVPSAKPNAVVDPTGCGDAYRAGLIHGLLQGLDWETTGRIGLPDGRDQDRVARAAESPLHPDRVRPAVSGQFWLSFKEFDA